MQVKYTFDSLEDFYCAANNCTSKDPTSISKHKMYHYLNNNYLNSYFIGLPIKTIPKYQYSYLKGLDNLEKLDNLQLGCSKLINKYSDIDGYDINYDRMLEGFPYLLNKTKSKGNKHGKFVTIWVNISINGNISVEKSLNKAYTVMKVIDYLENNGYRTEIIIYDEAVNVGYYQEKYLDYVLLKINIKHFNEPLIKGRILTAISPWMERYWVFKFNYAKFENVSQGAATNTIYKKDTKTDIFFGSTTAITKETAEYKIKQIQELFEDNETQIKEYALQGQR